MKNQTSLLSTFNNQLDKYIRWCTPSLHASVPRVRGVYENDISISLHSLGNPSLNTGIFKQAHQAAARTFKADNTLFSVNGSTGSNFVVLKALKRQLREIRLVAQRNIHKSIGTAVQDYQIDVTYIEPLYDQKLQIFLPNSFEQIVQTIIQANADVLLLTNPTYEGLSHNLSFVVKQLRKKFPQLIIFIDEAWGSLFSFHPSLPTSAMQAGADVCVQSTHKQGTSLQQTGMIHWRNARIESKYMYEAYRSLATTSPSFHLLASLDGSREFLQNSGTKAITDLIEMSNFAKSLFKKINCVKIANLDLFSKNSGVHKTDPTKILLKIERVSGIQLAKNLEKKHNIVVEKYEMNHLLLLTTFQLTLEDVRKTAHALEEEIRFLQSNKKRKIRSQRVKKLPKFHTVILKALPSYQAESEQCHSVLLEKAIGKIAAEDVIPYPPGIPMILKGEKIQQKHVVYIQALKAWKDISVIMNDQSYKHITVIKE